MVCAFATNQYTHSQTGPSVEAVPETLLSLRGLVSDVPEVSTVQALICMCVPSLKPGNLQSRECVPSHMYLTVPHGKSLKYLSVSQGC